jgi:hypothetical protein
MSSQQVWLPEEALQQLDIQEFVIEKGAVVPFGDPLRNTTIGGSEIGGVLGWNPDMTPGQIVQAKFDAQQGKSVDFDVAPCNWGKLFEIAADMFVREDLCTTTYGQNVCFTCLPYIRCTPDAVAVLHIDEGKRNQLVKKNDDLKTATASKIYLLEYKCPYSSTGLKDGDIPQKYKAQIWLGLAVVDLAYRGLYVATIFRKCKRQFLETSIYDTWYHNRDRARYANNTPLAWGEFNIYAPASERKTQTIDYGDVHPKEFNDMLSKVGKKEWVSQLASLYHVSSKHQITDIPQTIIPSNMVLVGYIPFKLVNVIYRQLDSLPNFLSSAQAAAANIFKRVEAKKAQASASI